MFKFFGGDGKRAERCYREQVEKNWPEWKEVGPTLWKQIFLGIGVEEATQSLIYRRLMSEFWMAVIAMETPWTSINVDGSFQAERPRRQQLANAIMAALPAEAKSGVARVIPPAFLPLIAAKRDLSGDEYRAFIAYEYLAIMMANVALQQVPEWRKATNDRAAWTNQDLAHFYKEHDTRFIRTFASLKRTLGWDEIPLNVRVV